MTGLEKTAIEIARMDEGDAKVMARLHATSFPAPWSAQDFALFLTQPGMMAWAVGRKDPSGFVLMRRLGEEAEIITIAIAPNARRGGLARALMEEALEHMRRSGVASVFLEVAVTNDAAIALYRRLGFENCGTRRNYYQATPESPRTDAAVMRKDL